MQFLKSLGDGVGTAAGVAWPIFGVTLGSLGLAIGGISAIILGAISIAVFLLVAIPVTCWSYQNYLKEKNELLTKLQEKKQRMRQSLRTHLLKTMTSSDKLPSIDEQCNEKEKSINNITVPLRPHIKTAISGFFAASGTIFGCGSGICGMLIGLGVFTGLSAIPFVGLGILIGGVIFGLIVAGSSAYYSYQKSKMNAIILECEKICKEVDALPIALPRSASSNDLFPQSPPRHLQRRHNSLPVILPSNYRLHPPKQQFFSEVRQGELIDIPTFSQSKKRKK